MERGVKRGPGRPRGTSRGGAAGIGRLHSSERSHHQNQHQPQQQQYQSPISANNNNNRSQSPLSPSLSSTSFNFNFADQTTADSPAHAQIRTPSSRGRARGFHAAYQSSSSSSPAVSASFPAKMDIRTPRSEKLPKSSQLHHSFTFSTPMNNKNDHSLRKRARTFEFGLDGAADDEAEVKGGHSLRKRARVDYAQIGDEEESTQDPNDMNIANKSDTKSVTGLSARGRKRRVNEVESDIEDLPPSTVTKKRGRYEKQRTESPASSRRKAPQKKPSTQSKPFVEHEPSDTELKDTIEVGVQYSEYESSDEQSSFKQSDTASVSSDHANTANVVENIAAVDDQSAESHNTVPTTNHPEISVSAPTGDKSVKTEETAIKYVQEFPEHVKADSLPIDPALSALSNQPLTDNNVSIDGSFNERSATNGVSVSKTTAEAEKGDSGALNQVSAAVERSKAVTGTIETEAPHEDQPKSLPAQLDEPTPTEDKATPQSQATEAMLTNASSSTTTVAEDAGIEQLNSCQPEAGEASISPQERYKDLRPGSVVIDDDGEVIYTVPKDKGTVASLRASQRRRQFGIEDNALDPDKVFGKIQDRSLSPNSHAVDSPFLAPSSRGPSSRDSSFQPELLPQSSTPPVFTVPPQPARVEALATPSKVGRPRGRRRKADQEAKAQAAQRTLDLTPGGQVAEHDYSYLSPYVTGEVETYPENAGESLAPTPAPEASEPAEDRIEAADDQPDEDSQQQPDGIEEQLAIDPTLESATNFAESADTPMDSGDAPSPGQDTNNGDVDLPTPDEPVIESMRPRKARKQQFTYQRLTSPSVFIDVLKNHKDMSDADLYTCLENVVDCLVVWQDEWQSLKLITDDEDNAVRRRAADMAFESKVEKQMKMLQALKKKNQGGPVDMTPAVEKDFAIKGVRVKEPTYKSDKAYYRAQDQIMAQAYGFEYDPRETMVSKQDPINQRDGLQNSRLRNRPKLSQRAAEAAAEDPAANIISGKRTRRPRGVEDQSETQSRAGTPVEAPRPSGRGRRRGPMPRQNTSNSIDTTVVAQTNGEEEPFEEVVPKRRGRPGPKPRIAAAAPAEDQQTDVEKPKKKRGRRPKAETITQETADDIAEPKPKRQRRGPGRPPNNRVEIPAASFYDNPSPADTEPTPTDDSRPTTSSSSGTAHTAESNYSFRERKRKNYTELANVGIAGEVEPKPKRARRTKKEPTPTPPIFHAAPATGFFPAMANGPALAPAPPRDDHSIQGIGASGGVTKMKIKITNNKSKTAMAPNPALAPAPFPFPIGGPGHPMTGPHSRSVSAAPSKAPSRRATPAPSVGSSSAAPAADSEKDYASMTKSEKMSASMKARWANGSMQRAVDKRKETLARKKETLKQQTGPEDKNTPMGSVEPPPGLVVGTPAPHNPFGGGEMTFPPFHAYAPSFEHSHQHNGV